MPRHKKSFARILLGIDLLILVFSSQARRARGRDSCSRLPRQKYRLCLMNTIVRRNGFRPAVECVQTLSRGVYQFEQQTLLSGLQFARVYSFFRKGSQPRGMSCVAWPCSSTTSTLREGVIFPIAVRATPRKVFGRSFALRDRKSTRLNSSHLGISYA